MKKQRFGALTFPHYRRFINRSVLSTLGLKLTIYSSTATLIAISIEA